MTAIDSQTRVASKIHRPMWPSALFVSSQISSKFVSCRRLPARVFVFLAFSSIPHPNVSIYACFSYI
uniref:Uncharacterized protein n=1 Tax=Panagrellus redivivus TaxID=6233 RepID=A0A7E4VD28_PANRE